jgi:hypothetical protein
MTAQTDFMTETMRAATENFTRTLQAGIKFQEQNAQFWSDLVGRSTEDFRTQWDRLARDAAPFQQKNLEAFHRLFEEQSQRTLDLLRRSVELGQAQSAGSTYEQLAALWRTSFETLRESADAIARTNAQMFESWSELMRKVPAGAAGKTGSKVSRK